MRRPDGVLHLDSAAAGRLEPATVEAVAAHLRCESRRGAYVAEEEAGEVLAGLRSGLAALFGVPDDGVALVESGTSALDALIGAWRLGPADRVGVAPSEWGPNLEAVEAVGATCVPLPVNPDGVIDLAGLAETVARERLSLVHLDQVSAHRGLVQPVADVVAVCEPLDVPVWVDAAQALGHVELAPGVAAAYATSRKWLRGPRGVGVLAVAERHWDQLAVRRQRKLPDAGPVRLLESGESNVAGRVGLAAALDAYLESGPAVVAQGLVEVGRRTRERFVDLPGWAVLPGAGPITALRPVAGQDVVAERARLLLEHGVLTTASLPWRSPLEPATPTLRLSPHLDTSDADLSAALVAFTGG